MYDDTHPFSRYGWSLMSYIESSLSQSEKIEVTFPLHWASRLNLWACIVIGFFLMGLPWLYAIYEYYRLKNIEIAVTNKRVVLKQGIFGRYTEELKIDAIESIEIWQGVYGRCSVVATSTSPVEAAARSPLKISITPSLSKAQLKACLNWPGHKYFQIFSLT